MADTAYREKKAFEYDQRRFVSPQGKVFHAMEWAELQHRLQGKGQGGSVLEVGCGTGRFLPLVAEYADELTGVDPSEDMLQIARKKVEGFSHVKLMKGEGAQLDLPDSSQDFVYSIRTINQVESREYALRMIRELFRVCKPGGEVLVEILNQKSLNRTRDNTRFSVDEICEFITKEKLGNVLDVSGILFLTQTLLDRVPAFLLPLYRIADKTLSTLFKKNCTRCYIHARKSEADS